MEVMMVLFLLLTIWTIADSSWAEQQTHTEHQPLWAPPPPQTIATLDLTKPTTYPTFITNMRNALSEKDSKGNYVLQCSMQKISSTVPSQLYAYIDIKPSDDQTLTLAIDRTNSYVLGYRDEFNGNERAFFFEEVFSSADKIFPTVAKQNRLQLKYSSQYDKIGKREGSLLGIYSLQVSIENIYGKAIDKSFDTLQRKFFIIALQMIAEAARFKYISDKIPIDNEYENLKVDQYVIGLENGWGTLSTAVYDKTKPSTTTTKCALTQPVSLNVWTFTTVEEIAQVLSLLRAKKTRKLSTNNDHGGVVEVASS